jgi:hypothetical protein
MDKVKIDIFLK